MKEIKSLLVIRSMSQIELEGPSRLLLSLLPYVYLRLQFIGVRQISDECADLLQFRLGLGDQTRFKIGLGQKPSDMDIIGIRI